MKRLFEKLRQMLARGEAAVLVTVIASSGSSPRGAGARMLVKADGEIQGTIGGGAVEYHAVQIAMEALKEKSVKKRFPYIKGFTLTKNQISDIGMVCGGEVTVCFQYIDGEDRAAMELCAQALAAFERDADAWLFLDITEETCGRMGIYDREGWRGADFAKELEMLMENKVDIFGGHARSYSVENRKFYVEPLVQAGTVYIFGGGHVAQELVPVLAHLGFPCVVMDDRKEFANPGRFPQARRTVVGDMERISDYLDIKEQDYACVMTRGHSIDYLALRQVLARGPRYIGVMGSRNKVALVTEKLLGDGFSQEEIERCHMPIGVEIYAKTPAEIAVSIAGELIAARAGRECGRK